MQFDVDWRQIPLTRSKNSSSNSLGPRLGILLGTFGVLFVASLIPTTAWSQECPEDAPLYCDNCAGYCCPESHPYCTSDCQCAADDGSGGGGGGGSGGDCPSGSYECGEDYCTENGRVCCASVGRPELSCPEGTTCTSDGECIEGENSGGSSSEGSGGQSTQSCPPDQLLTRNTCGESACSCADPCSTAGDCNSGCCIDGYCALPCVCNGEGVVEYDCGSAGAAGDSPYACSASGSRSPGNLALLGALLLVFGILRRRRKQESQSSLPIAATLLPLLLLTGWLTACEHRTSASTKSTTAIENSGPESASPPAPARYHDMFGADDDSRVVIHDSYRAATPPDEEPETVAGTPPTKSSRHASTQIASILKGGPAEDSTSHETRDEQRNILRVSRKSPGETSDTAEQPSNHSAPTIVMMAAPKP